MSKLEEVRIFLASPGDVAGERRHVERVVADLNRSTAAQMQLVLRVVSWDKDTYPGYGADAQGLINRQIAEMAKYALFIGIMWNRLGTPTPRADSGTVEEFERAADSLAQNGRPEIWFYFRNAASLLKTEQDLEQRKQVIKFKDRLGQNGMSINYKTPADFRDQFRNHLQLWLPGLQGDVTTPAASATAGSNIGSWDEFKEEMISQGGVFYLDPWETANSEAELSFKNLLKGRLGRSMDLLNAAKYEDVVELWQPLSGNPYFSVSKGEWEDKPYFRCQIHSAKCHLFIAHIQLGQRGNWEEHVPRAFAILKEILEGNPYSLKGASQDRLPKEIALVRNSEYESTLEMALHWFNGWSPAVLTMFDITEQESQKVIARVEQRLSEIRFLLRLRESDSGSKG